ncbi:MAG: hypothetical protein QM473_03810 [Acidobacteriota bacterium]|nr:hypothetical protein [Acidobacteriota bacterium]
MSQAAFEGEVRAVAFSPNQRGAHALQHHKRPEFGGGLLRLKLERMRDFEMIRAGEPVPTANAPETGLAF